MKVVPAEEENESEVRREDQDNINQFARLNARLHEIRDERDLLQVCPFTILSVTQCTGYCYEFHAYVFSVLLVLV